jgi:Lipocalin-like domain
MNRRKLLGLSAISALGLAVSGGNAAAQSAKDLVGSWTAVSVDAYGPNPKGSLIFEANGRFSLQLMRTDLPKYLSNNRTQGTPAEYKATVEGSLSYFGTYSVSGTDLILHVEGSTFPNWTGTDQKRINLSVTGDELKYTNPAPSGGVQPGVPNTPLVWRRVK